MKLRKGLVASSLFVAGLCIIGAADPLDSLNLPDSDEKILSGKYSTQKMMAYYKEMERSSRDIYKLHKKFKYAYEQYAKQIGEIPEFAVPQNKLDLQRYFNTSAKWYDLLIALDKRLSSVDVQETRESYADHSLVRTCRRSSAPTRKVSQLGLDFLYPGVDADENYRSVKDLDVDVNKGRVLCELVKVCLTDRPYTVVNVDEDTVRITGDFIRLRDFDDRVSWNVTDTSPGRDKNARVRQFFALNTIFVDANVTAPASDCLIVIGSPRWVVLTRSDLQRYGLDGTQPDDWRPTIDLTHPDGAGSFRGFGMNFSGLENLRIVTARSPTEDANDDVLLYQFVPEGSEQNYTRDYVETGAGERQTKGWVEHNLMNVYKKHLLWHLWDNARLKLLAEFLYRWSTYTHFRPRTFNLAGFQEELENLESVFLKLCQSMDLLPVYQNFEERLLAANEESNWTTSPFMRALYAKVTTALTAKRNFLSPPNEPMSKIEIFMYARSYELKNTLTIDNRTRSRHIRYMKRTLQDRTGEVMKLVTSDILPQVLDINENLDDQLNAPNDAHRLRRSAERLKQIMYLQRISANLQAFVKAWSTDFNDDLEELVLIEEPKGSAVSAMKDINTNYVKYRTYILKHLLKSLDKNDPLLFGLREIINNTTNELSTNAVVDSFGTVDSYVQKMLNSCNDTEDAEKCTFTSNTLNAIINLRKKLRVAEMSPQMYIKYKNNPTIFDALNEVITSSDLDKAKRLEKHEHFVQTYGMPLVKYLLAYMNRTAYVDKPAAMSAIAAIDTRKWQLSGELDFVKSEVRQLTEELASNKKLIEMVEKLQLPLKNTFDVFYDKITYIEFKRIDERMERRDLPYEATMRNLELLTDQNIILLRHNQLFDAFKQYIFPVVEPAKGLIDLDPNLENNVHATTSEMAVQAVWQILAMRIRLPTYKTTLAGGYHGRTVQTTFTDASNSGPFFAWSFADDNEPIRRLFRGENVTLRAVANASDENSVRFNALNLRFLHRDPQVEAVVDDKLKDFQVTLTPSNASYYRCDDEFYKVTVPRASMTFRAGHQLGNRTEDYNHSYWNAVNTDILSSPYTEWTMKLSPANDKANFADLSQFEFLDIDLQLEGHGQYLEGENVCSADLGYYYTIVQ